MTREETYRSLHVGDIISIYDTPYRLARLDKDHIATLDDEDHNNKLTLWAYDEVKRIPINKLWCQELNMPIVADMEEAKHLSVHTLAYCEQDDCIVMYDSSLDDVIFFDNCEYIDEVQQKYFEMTHELPSIILYEDSRVER